MLFTLAFTLTNMSIFQDIPFRFPSTMMKVDMMVIVRVYIMPRFSRFREKCTTCNIILSKIFPRNQTNQLFLEDIIIY